MISILLVLLAAGPIIPPRVFLTTPTPTVAVCPGDQNGDGSVSIAEIIRAVKASLDGCE